VSDTSREVAVLVVDDVEDSRVALKAFLEAEGIRAVLARSGAEALEALLVHDVALALIDVQMPGMNGFELAELMRGTERTRTIPIIFVTGVAAEPARVFKGYEAGAVDYLVKPVDPRLLKGKVETFVELHRQRHQLSTQLARLQEMLRLSDMFVAVLGHDLRGPLQSVELGSQVILGRPDDPAAVTKMAHTMQRASRRMARLIEQLLDFARARLQGDFPIVPVACDLAELTRSAVSELDPAAAARVTLETSGDQHVTWDHDRIAQVLSNVLGNAAQHGSPNQPITIAVAGDADRVTIEIRNHGHIPPELLPMLFDPFTRAETRRQKTSGLGLGLYIVDQIVKAHGGVVRVDSSESDGTCFRIELPRRADR
jgi:two-component system sensor histidine kinase/response regulator